MTGLERKNILGNLCADDLDDEWKIVKATRSIISEAVKQNLKHRTSPLISRALEERQARAKEKGYSLSTKSDPGNGGPGGLKDINVKSAVLDYIEEKMFGVDPETKKSWVETFIDDSLKIALNDPKSFQAERYLNTILQNDLLKQMEEHKLKSRKRDLNYTMWQIRQTLYDRQQEVFDAIFGARAKQLSVVVLNSRRSGKTNLMGKIIVAEASKEGINGHPREIAYINRTSSAAIRQIKGPLMDAMAEVPELQIAKGSVEGQEVTFNNGNKLLVIGNNNASDVDKLRGEALSCVLLDECGHQRNIRQLVREVLQPALRDFPDGELIMTGTPPRIPGTYIEEVFENAEERGWKKFHWTMFENPFIPGTREEIINQICQENNTTEDDPFIRREYFGELSVYDDDARVIKHVAFDKRENINNTSWDYAYIGVDWGFEDKAAVVGVLGKKKVVGPGVLNNNGSMTRVVWNWSEARKSISEICDRVLECRDYINKNFKVAHTVQVICDNNEKSAVMELSQVYHIPNVMTAYKYDVPFALNQLNEFFQEESLRLEEGPLEPLIEDIDKTLYIRDEETGKILYGEIDDDSYHPNSLFALLYVSRQFAIDIYGKDKKNKKAKHITDQRLEIAEQVTGLKSVRTPRNIEEAKKAFKSGDLGNKSLIEEPEERTPVSPLTDADLLR